MLLRFGLLMMFFCLTSYVHATEYVSVSVPIAVLYDQPSVNAIKIGTVSGPMPYQVIGKIRGWVEVFDSLGYMYWLESRDVSSKRGVLVMQRMIDVFDSPQFSGRVLFRAGQDVVLEWEETIDTGWVRVRHQDGEVGYVRTEDVWGW